MSRIKTRGIDLSVDGLLRMPRRALIQRILEQSDIQVPLGVFSTETPPLQALVKYLREEQKLSMNEIALRLNRNIQTIWTSYRAVAGGTLVYRRGTDITLPLSIFSKERYSILETVVYVLHSIHHKSFSEIGTILNRNERTVWTCNHRYQTKQGGKNEL